MGGRRLGVVALAFVSGCLFTVDDNEDGPAGGGGGLTVGFDMPESSVDETVGSVDIPVYLSAMPTEVTTVNLSLGGTATLGDDYISGEGTIAFLPGIDFYFVHFEITADELPEDAETIELSLSLPINARIGTSHHTLEIRPNLLPRVTFASAGRTGYEAGGGGLQLLVMPASPVPITVGYTVGGTADGSDYTLQPGTVTIPAGATTYDLSLGLVTDSIDEEDTETIEVTLVDPVNAILGEFPSATFQLYDSDPRPSASFVTNSPTLMEGNSGMQLVTAEVQLEKASARQLEVAFYLDQFLVEGNTATAGSDYAIMTPSPLVFPAGTTSQTITIALYGDTLTEGREKLTLALAVGEWFSVVIENDECYGTGAYTVCSNTAPLGSITIPDGTLNTFSSQLCADLQPRGWIDAGQPQACFIIASDITVGTVRAYGYPLVLVATNSITVNGLLDVGGHIGSYGTTSNSSAPCGPFGSMPTTMSGGAGGSFMTAGGNGGDHNGPTGAGGIAAPAVASPPAVLRTGCGGQAGWENSGAGFPGGIVYIVAGASITLASGSTVNASGAPGKGGNFINDAGNGGGSGGMIALHAPTFAVSGARLLANGGAGGEGDDNGVIDGTYGTDGSEVDYTSPSTPAPGGTGTGGGDGGRGASQGVAAAPGAGASSAASAGAGGGGLGYILASQPMTGALVSPAPAAF